MEMNQIEQIMSEIEGRATDAVYEVAPYAYIFKSDKPAYDTAFEISDLVNNNSDLFRTLKELSSKVGIECNPIPNYGSVISNIEARGIEGIKVFNNKPILKDDFNRYVALFNLKKFVIDNQNIFTQLSNLARQAGIETNAIVSGFAGHEVASELSTKPKAEETPKVQIVHEEPPVVDEEINLNNNGVPGEVTFLDGQPNLDFEIRVPGSPASMDEKKFGPYELLEEPDTKIGDGKKQAPDKVVPVDLEPQVPNPAAPTERPNATKEALEARLPGQTNSKTARVMELLRKQPTSGASSEESAALVGDPVNQDVVVEAPGQPGSDSLSNLDQDEITVVPVVPVPDPVKERNYTPMTDEEIRNAQINIGMEPTTVPSGNDAEPTTAYRSYEGTYNSEPVPENEALAPIVELPKYQGSNPQKVTSRRLFSWTDGVAKWAKVQYGLWFAKDLSSKSPKYRELHLRIQQLDINYKTMSHDEVINEYNALDRELSTDSSVPASDKKELYRRLSSLSKRIKKFEEKHQGNSRIR